MFLGSPDRRREPLHALPMAAALVLAAFLGAASGLIWQLAGPGESAEQDEDDSDEGEEDA